MRNFLPVMVLLALPVAAWPQAAATLTATIEGKLLDPNRNAVTGTGASVMAANSADGAVATTPVLPDGSYRFTGLREGTYNLTVPMACCMYSTYRQQGVPLKAGETKHLDLPIPWGINLGTIGDDPVMLMNDMRARAKVPQAATPRTAEGKPDFSGVWATVSDPTANQVPPMQPWAAKLARERAESQRKDAPGNFCLPNSPIPFLMPFHYRFVQNSISYK